MNRQSDNLPTSLPSRFQPSPTEQRRAMDAERARARRLRLLLEQELEVREMRDPAEISALSGLSPLEADKLLTRRHWRVGDLEMLERIAARLGLPVVGD